MIDCSKCLEAQGCCGIMIFPKQFIEKFKDKIEKGQIQILEKDDFVTYLYNDMRCPFLDRKTRLCKIYENRLKICKDYGYIEELQCPYFKKSGNRRSLASQTKIERMIDKKLSSIQKL